MGDIDGMRIKAAAVMTLHDKKVYTGRRHGEILLAMKEAGVERLDCARAEQGFVTECGRFVRRKPALRIALAAGQLMSESDLKGSILTSEDLW